MKATYTMTLGEGTKYATKAEVTEIAPGDPGYPNGFNPRDPESKAIDGTLVVSGRSRRVALQTPAGVDPRHLLELYSPWAVPASERLPKTEEIVFAPGSTHLVLGKPYQVTYRLGRGEKSEIFCDDDQRTIAVEVARPLWSAAISESKANAEVSRLLQQLQKQLADEYTRRGLTDKARRAARAPRMERPLSEFSYQLDDRQCDLVVLIGEEKDSQIAYKSGGTIEVCLSDSVTNHFSRSDVLAKEGRACVRSVQIGALKTLINDVLLETACSAVGVSLASLTSERADKGRWGACSVGDAEVFLNEDLARLTPASILLTLVHECCHVKVWDHSKRFYDLLEKAYPKAAASCRVRGVEVPVSWKAAALMI